MEPEMVFENEREGADGEELSPLRFGEELPEGITLPLESREDAATVVAETPGTVVDPEIGVVGRLPTALRALLDDRVVLAVEARLCPD